MAGKVRIISIILLLTISMQMCCGSAIPIWEFLTRTEKMSYLYSTFAQLVSVHCKATAATSAIPVNQCKRNLLTYGNEKLQTFSEAQLDALDPYQRGANELIWSSIMRDHPSATLITTRKPLPTPPDSSIIILTHQQPQTVGATATATTVPTQQQATAATTQQNYPKNPIFDTPANDNKHKFAMDMDIAYGYPGMTSVNPAQVETFDSNQRQTIAVSSPLKTYLTGPLVFRVRPDGTPVEEDQYRPLPRDDDLEAYRHHHHHQQHQEYQQQQSTQQQLQRTTTNNGNNSGRPNKHRKIATISALKQQRMATLALQQELQPPFESPRVRRQFQTMNNNPAMSAFNGYFYGRGQA